MPRLLWISMIYIYIYTVYGSILQPPERWQKVRKVQFPPGDGPAGRLGWLSVQFLPPTRSRKRRWCGNIIEKSMILDLLCFDKHILFGALYYLHWLLRKMVAFSDDHRSQSLKLFRPRTSSGKKSCGSTWYLSTAWCLSMWPGTDDRWGELWLDRFCCHTSRLGWNRVLVDVPRSGKTWFVKYVPLFGTTLPIAI